MTERPHAPHAYRPVRTLWWIYFALIALYWLLAVFSVHTLSDGLQAAFFGFGLVGLWGYLRHVAIGWRALWIAYLALFVLWVVGNIVLHFVRGPAAGVLPALIAAFGVLLVFGLAAWALWRYSFRCASLWQRRPKDAPAR